MDYTGNSPGQNTEMGSHSLLQGIFPTQGSNQGLLHCRWTLYQLSYQGSPYNSTDLFFYSSGGRKSKLVLTGLK